LCLRVNQRSYRVWSAVAQKPVIRMAWCRSPRCPHCSPHRDLAVRRPMTATAAKPTLSLWGLRIANFLMN